MSVFRVHKTANFTVMSNHHFKEKGMSLKAKGLLSLMLSLPDDWNYSVSGLVTLSKDGKDSVMSALAELEEFGYLARNRTTNSKGQFSGIEYHIFESPQTENPIAETPISANSNEEKSNAEKPSQSNKELIKDLNNQELNESNKDIKENDLSIYDDVLKHIKDIELKSLLIDYVEMRENIAAPISKRGLSMLINRLARITNFDNQLQKNLLETAIINNWKNVYLPKEEDSGGTQYPKSDYYDEIKKFYEEG